MQISWGRRKNEWCNPIWLELNQLAALNQQGGLWTIENKKSSAPAIDISVSPHVKESKFPHPENFYLWIPKF